MSHEEWIQIRYQHKRGFIELFTAPTESIKVISKNTESLDQTAIYGSPESITRRTYMKLDLERFLMNFSFQSNTGTRITHQNLGGKYLFIEFWASWCKPCRVSNQEINHQKDVFLHDKLYTCFVSLDKDPLKWKEAIAADKLQWANHAIDEYDPEKSFAKSIGIVFIPTNLLVDPNGQVMLKNAKPEEIKAFLDKLK